MFRKAAAVLGASVLLSGLGVTAASAAASSAPVTSFVQGNTTLTNRPDSGGNGDWNTETITRNLSIQLTGGTPGHWHFTATVTDLGNFRTIVDAYTPNQSGFYHGDRIPAVLAGRMSGFADYSFTADTLPAKSNIPATENGAPVTARQTTSFWFEQAFPTGTTFGGTGILNDWRWSYTAPGCGPGGTTTWLDAAFNNDGQLPFDGNIGGFCF